jgi:hypothetical protein
MVLVYTQGIQRYYLVAETGPTTGAMHRILYNKS